MSIIVWLIIINIAVFIHELAHYSLAKWQGVNVKAFSIGMGPILARWNAKGTEWRISALPIGGYVDIDGMTPTIDENGNTVPPSTGMAKLGYWGKFAVLFAGPLSNIILAILIIAVVLIGQGKPVTTNNAELYSIQPGSSAEKAGFKPLDVITKVDNQVIKDFQDVRNSLSKNGIRTFSVKRLENGKPRNLEIKFDWSPVTKAGQKRPIFGVSIGAEQFYQPVAPLQALSDSTTTLLGAIPMYVSKIFEGIFNTFAFKPSDVSGPVGTVKVVGTFLDQGFYALLYLAGMINFGLGIFNLLPIPGLDGGRILLNSISAIRRRPFAPGQEEFINFIGFAFVLVFMALVTLKDVFVPRP
jgi:regulator of sigma E protease